MDLAQAENLGRTLLKEHGLSHWYFKLDRSVRRFGACWPGRAWITISRHLAFLNTEQEVRNTILHEIAHALTPGDHHGFRWAQKCKELGIEPSRCYNEQGNGRAVVLVKGRWVAKCNRCGKEFRKYRRPRMGRISACRDCCIKYANGKFSGEFELTYHKENNG